MKIVLAALALTLGANVSAAESKRELRVAAASDLQFAFQTMASEFQKTHPGLTITPIFGSSGNFVAQVKNGAPFDIFFSADAHFPETLVQDGKDLDGKFDYARGKIVLWVRNESKIDLKKGLAVLTSPEVKKVAIANATHAPYGRAAEEALKSAGVLSKVSSKFVTGENISQTAQFAESGAADVGIIAMSLAKSPKLTQEGHFEVIDEKLYPEMVQSGVILKSTKLAKDAREFRNFVLSAEGTKIMAQFGLQPIVLAAKPAVVK